MESIKKTEKATTRAQMDIEKVYMNGYLILISNISSQSLLPSTSIEKKEIVRLKRS